MLGVDEDVFAPETVDDLLAGDDVAILFEEQKEQLHGDAFEFQGAAVAAQLETGGVQLELIELVDTDRHTTPQGGSPETIALMPGDCTELTRNCLRTACACSDLRIHLSFTESSPRLYCPDWHSAAGCAPRLALLVSSNLEGSIAKEIPK